MRTTSRLKPELYAFLRGSNEHIYAGHEIRVADAAEVAGIHGDCGADSGAGHRREHGDFFAHRSNSAAQSARAESAGTRRPALARAESGTHVSRYFRRSADFLLSHVQRRA